MTERPNWFGRLLNRLTGSGSTTRSRVVHTGRTAAGVYVDADTALKNATVWACVQYLTKAVAQLPWRAHVSVNGKATVASTNPVDWLIHRRPNPEMGSFTFRQTLLSWALRHGNGYAEIQRDNRGAAFALWPLHPDRVTPRRNRDTGVLEYDVQNHADRVTLAAEDVFHLRGMGEGAVGLSVMDYAAQSIGWAQATELFGATFFGQGMNPSGIITTEKGLDVPALEILRSELKKLYSGPKGEKTAILDAGMKFEKLATQPNDAQFIETRQHQVEEICRWFGVPPHKVMHLLRATFSNIEHQSIEVVVDSVTPWVKLFEEEADYKLFGPVNRQGLYTKMNLRGLLRGDSAGRAQLYNTMFQVGAMSPNMILELEDLEGIGPEGDQHFVPMNMTPLHLVEDLARVKLAAPPAAPADPVPEDPDTPPAPAAANGVRVNGLAPR